MTYIVLVLCHNEVHYIKPFDSIVEAQGTAIVLANEWYKQDGLDNFSKDGIETIEQMHHYYHSESYLTVETLLI